MEIICFNFLKKFTGKSVWYVVSMLISSNSLDRLWLQKLGDVFSALVVAKTSVSVETNKSSAPKEETISLLDSKRALVVNIFLKQFKCSSDEIVDHIKHGDSNFFTIEKLDCLQKMLPTSSEVIKKLNIYF